MVKLYTSLLAITLATSLALAFSDKYRYSRSERRLYCTESECDPDEEFVEREYADAYVALEARHPKFGSNIKKVVGSPVFQMAGEKAVAKAAMRYGPRIAMALFVRDYPSNINDQWHRRDLEDVEELLGRASDPDMEEFFEWE